MYRRARSRTYIVIYGYSICLHPVIENSNAYYNPSGSRVSSGSIVSDYGLDDRANGVRSPEGAEDFFL
jgi:hypothetical protein